MSWPSKITSEGLLENAKREVGEIVVREAVKTSGNIIPALIASSEQKILDKIGTPPSAPSLNVSVVKLQDCPEEFDDTKREAKFAFRLTDLENLKNSTCAAVVIYFPRGELTNLFQAAKDEKTGHLEAYRATHFDKNEFEKAKEFGTAVTCPLELFDKAKQVKSNGTKYNPIDNNCQIWLKAFLTSVSPSLYQSFEGHSYAK